MSDRRFAISLHILTLMSQNMGHWLPSEYIARSININPVLVRMELSNLQKHGFTETREGKSGGSKLRKRPEDIHLSEIFAIMRKQTILGKRVGNPNPDCPVGYQINNIINQLEDSIESRIMDDLGLQTLADFGAKFKTVSKIET